MSLDCVFAVLMLILFRERHSNSACAEEKRGVVT